MINIDEQIMVEAFIYFLLVAMMATCLLTICKPIKKWQICEIRAFPSYPHLCESMDALVVSPKLLRWVEKINKTQIDVRAIRITDVNWFSANPDPKKLGFVKFNVIALDKLTMQPILSNVVFLRGDSVAILIVVKVVSNDRKNRSKEYVLLCEQMRVASGGRRTELCAGMMDDDGNIASVVLKEVKEETGFDIKHRSELIELGSIFPSPGACDEEIFMYAWKTTITETEFEEKQCRLFGNATEGEEIKLSFVPMKDMGRVLAEIKDVKAECAYRRYNNLYFNTLCKIP